MSYMEVDTDTPNDPLLWAPYNGFRTVVHKGMGFLPFDPGRVGQYLTKEQEQDRFVSGYELHEQLQGLPLLNANYLDAWLRLARDLDPKEAKDMLLKLYPLDLRFDRLGFSQYLFFWGTLYENAAGRRFVRYACCMTRKSEKGYSGRMSGGFVGLDSPYFRCNAPAAVWK